MVNLQSVVEDDDINDIGPGCYIYVLDLGFELKYSHMWVRKDYNRIYEYCTRWHEDGHAGPRCEVVARSVRQPGEKGKTFGRVTPSVVVSAKETRFSCILIASATVVEYFKAV